MALCARVTKPGSGAYGTRHARVRPSVTHCVLAVRETVVMKPSRLNIMAQGISSSLPVPFLSPYTHLSLSQVDSDQAASKRADRVHYERRERSRSIYTSHTHPQASLLVSHCTTLVAPLRLCIEPAHEAGLSTST